MNPIFAVFYIPAILAALILLIKYYKRPHDKKEESETKKIKITEDEDDKHAEGISKYLTKYTFHFLKADNKQKEVLGSLIKDAIIDYVKINGK